MKLQLLFISILLIILSESLLAQNIDQEYIYSKIKHDYFYTGINVNETTYLGGSKTTCQNGSVASISHDNIVGFNHVIPQDHVESFWHVSDLEYRESDSLLIGCGNWSLTFDVGTDLDGHYIFGMDLEGNTIFESHLPGIFSSNPNLTLLPNDDMVIVRNSGLAFLNTIGEITETIVLSHYTNPILNVGDLGNNKIFTYNSNNIYFLNHQGDLLDSLPSNEPIIDSYHDDTHIYFLRESDLMIYDLNTEIISYSNSYNSEIDSPQKIIGNSNSIFLYELNNSSFDNDEIIQINKTSLDVVESFTFEPEDTQINFILATETDLQIVGTKDRVHSFIKSKKIDSPLEFEDLNLQISNVFPLDTLIVVDSSMLSGADFYIYDVLDRNVSYSFDVTNLSNTDITEFSTRSEVNTSISQGCHLGCNINYFENVLIEPNQTKTFIGNHYYNDYFFYSNQINSSYTPEIFAPNHKFDLDYSDNIGLEIRNFLSETKDLSSIFSEWNITPNPARNYINFNAQLNENIEEINISIFNAQGQEVKNVGLNINSNFIQEKINVAELENGLYWLSIRSSKEIISKSFVVIK